jgi:hypothetical protein
MRRIFQILCAILCVATSSVATLVGAAGYWNVPSTFCQCFGFGCYHAPLVLGPSRCDGWCRHNEIRLPYAPSSPAAWCGNYDCDCDCSRPSRLDVEVVAAPPVSGPVEAPVEAPGQPDTLFAPPIEQ